VDIFQHLPAGQAVFLQITAYVKMSWRIWSPGKSVVVVTKDPSLAIDINLIFEPGINYLESRSFRGALDSETIINAEKFPIPQLDRGQQPSSDNIVVSTLSLLKMETGPDRHHGVRQKKIQQIAECLGRVFTAALV